VVVAVSGVLKVVSAKAALAVVCELDKLTSLLGAQLPGGGCWLFWTSL